MFLQELGNDFVLLLELRFQHLDFGQVGILLPSDTGRVRLAVKGGGCSGLSYDMAFDKMKTGDHQFDYDHLKVFVDPKSFLYLDGMTFDYADTLKDKGFKFINPNASKTCGCGESFSV